MLLSAVSVLVVAQSSSEIPEGLMNNSVCYMQKCKAAEFAVYVVPVNGTFCRNLGF